MFPGTGWVFLGNNDWWEYNLRLWECDIPARALTCKYGAMFKEVDATEEYFQIMMTSFILINRLNTCKIFKLRFISPIV